MILRRRFGGRWRSGGLKKKGTVERGTKPDQTGPGLCRLPALQHRTGIRVETGARRKGEGGAAWPKKSSKSLGRSSPGRTKDRRRFPLCPSLNHSSPLCLSRPFSTPFGPFVLSSAPCSPLSSFASSPSSFSPVFKEQRASRSGRMPAPACDEEGRAVVPGRAREGTRERKMALT